jgi:drug/metabolite transporter (DMT)-like permease
MSDRKQSIGYLLAFASAVAGAVRYNLATYADTSYGFDYVPFLFWALAVGVLCSTTHVLAKDGWGGMVPLKGRWKQALLYGVLMAWGTLSHFIALRYLNETLMTSLSQTNILLTIALAVWLLGERFTRQEWIATFVIFGGVFLFRPWEGGQLTGVLILATGLLAGAFSTVVAKKGVAGIPPRTLMVWRNVVALVVVGSYTLFLPRPEFSWPIVIACVATGVTGPYLHGLFFLQALERIDAAKAALMNRVQPAIVFLLSWLFLSRLPTTPETVSALFLVAGTLWLALARRRAG